jgi:hypothetical protein
MELRNTESVSLAKALSDAGPFYEALARAWPDGSGRGSRDDPHL